MELALTGQIALWVALCVNAVALVLLGAGLAGRPGPWLKGGVLAVRALFILLTGAVIVLWIALLGDRFELVYVAINSSRLMEPIYKFGALWSGQAGSLLFWLWLLSAYAAALSWTSRPEQDEGRGLLLPALFVLSGISVFFMLLVTVVESPFRVALPAPEDGRGMNPLLYHPAMLVHPLFTYLGFVGFSVPFAFAMAALWRKRTDAAWLRRTRNWTLVAWMFLTTGIIVGGKWAYAVLGWGGYWSWDPVENASLLPWLTATAFIHSSLVQERRGMLKLWNVGLILGTFALTILGTFITRSGILSSVHAFAQSPIGPWFIGFLGVVIGSVLYLLIERWPALRQEPQFESYLSREVGFLFNNLLFLAAAFAVLWGTLFPLISRWRGVDITIGAPFFNQVVGPLLLAMLLLMGLGPILAWRRTSGDGLLQQLLLPAGIALFGAQGMVLFGIRELVPLLGFTLCLLVAALTIQEIVKAARVRQRSMNERFGQALVRLLLSNRRRYGGYIVHLGIVIMAAGILASSHYTYEVRTPLHVGEAVDVGPYRVQFLGLEEGVRGGVPGVYANLALYRDGRLVAYAQPEKRYFPGFVDTMGPTTEIVIVGSLLYDVYLVMAGFDESGVAAGFDFTVKPLVAWIWLGGYLVMAGTVFSLWLPRRPRRLFSDEVQPLLEDLNDLEFDFQTGKIDRATFEQRREALARLLADRLAREREALQAFEARVAAAAPAPGGERA